MFLAEVDCGHIVRELPNESHKVRIDIDFRVVRVRESRKPHMILPTPKLPWRKQANASRVRSASLHSLSGGGKGVTGRNSHRRCRPVRSGVGSVSPL